MQRLHAATGARTFEFVDSTFNAPLPYALALSELLARRLGQLLEGSLATVRHSLFLPDLQHGVIPWLERAYTALGGAPPLWRFAPSLRRAIAQRSRIPPAGASLGEGDG